jgi:hypothetical protein
MPGYQSGLDAGSCHARADVDVAAAGENVAVYQGGWQRVSGTSCASPLVAALFTRIGLESQANAFFYAHGSAFYDITSGNNDPDDRCNDVMCNAGVGWDGPTGWGTPNGAALLLALDADSGGAEADGGVKAGHDAPEAGEEDATTNDASEGTDATQGTVPEAGGAVEEGGDGTTAGSNGCGCVAAGAASSPQAPGGLLLLAVWLARRERSRARRG